MYPRRRLAVALLVATTVSVSLPACTSAPPTGLIVRYKTATPEPMASVIDPWLTVTNDSAVSVDLSEITVRYYFTADAPEAEYGFACVSAEVGCAAVTGSVRPLQPGTTKADHYLELGFTGSAGKVQAGAGTGEIRLMVYRVDGSMVDQSDDYSFGEQGDFASWAAVTAYLRGGLAWGSPPIGLASDPSPGSSSSESAAATTSPATAAGAGTSSPAVPRPPGVSGPPVAAANTGNTGNTGNTASTANKTNVLFDDFAYAGVGDANFARAWAVRTGSGDPGPAGARWLSSAVGFTATGGVTAMNLTAATDGSGSNTVQAEVDSRGQKFFTGTYAARIRFSDTPTGPAGGHVMQTFFTNTPLRYDNDPLYSAMNVEYVPIGGWGDNRRRLILTTYYTLNGTTGATDSQAAVKAQSYDGWHTAVIQAGNGVVIFYLDGVQVHSTSGKYYPRQPMSLCFSEWFIDGELGGVGAVRGYTQQVDWVYYAGGQVLAPSTVEAQVNAHRAAGTAFLDTVAG
jgi:hypothetical protein